MKLSDLPVYVCHCKLLPERRERLEPIFKSLDISAEWITDHDQNELTELDWVVNYSDTGNYPRRINAAELSLVMKHVGCYGRAVVEGKPVLVLEDDVVLVDDFRERFDRYFTKVPADYDFIFLGNCCCLRIPQTKEGVYFYRKSHPASKCTDSYIVSPSAAAKLLETMIPCHSPADFELNAQIERHDMKVYWLEPPIISQGSETGLYSSSVR